MRPEEQIAQPDAEDQDVNQLIGPEVEDDFPDTWPEEDEPR